MRVFRRFAGAVAPVCRLDDETSSLLAAGFLRYRSIQLYCNAHGWFRANVGDSEIGATWPCPECLAPCRCSVAAFGFTRGQLPQFSRLFGPIHWERITDDEPPPRQTTPACIQCGHEFTLPRGSNARLCPDCFEASARRRGERRARRMGELATKVSARPPIVATRPCAESAQEQSALEAP